LEARPAAAYGGVRRQELTGVGAAAQDRKYGRRRSRPAGVTLKEGRIMKTTDTAAEQLPDEQPDGTSAKTPKKRAKPPVRKPAPEIPPGDKLLLTAQEVSALTGLHVDVVYRWGKSGRLPSLRLGRTVRFPRVAIERWIERYQQGGE
jgi:excisionase family DNA binding protein